MLRALGYLSIIWGISESLLLQLSFGYVKQEFSWVGTNDWNKKTTSGRESREGHKSVLYPETANTKLCSDWQGMK